MGAPGCRGGGAARQGRASPDGGGEWTAFDNTCPHAGAPIYPEHFDGECVTCVYHGLRFRAADGHCPDAAGWELEPYPVRVEEGQVLVGFRQRTRPV
jgi:nitrite reductase/ring-hydroxylating ferredoxin subunit